MTKDKVVKLMDRINHVICYSNDKVWYDGKLEEYKQTHNF